MDIAVADFNADDIETDCAIIRAIIMMLTEP